MSKDLLEQLEWTMANPEKHFERKDRLIKRALWLEQRITAAEDEGENLRYDKAEQSAIQYVLAILNRLENNLPEYHSYKIATSEERKAK